MLCEHCGLEGCVDHLPPLSSSARMNEPGGLDDLEDATLVAAEGRDIRGDGDRVRRRRHRPERTECSGCVSPTPSSATHVRAGPRAGGCDEPTLLRAFDETGARALHRG